MKNLKYNCDYGKLEVNEATDVIGDGDYINVRLGTVHGDVEINADYGQIRIAEMSKDAGSLNVKSDYTGVKMGYHPDYSFNFEIDLEYGGFGGKDDLEVSVSNVKSSSKYYKGHHGDQNSGNFVSISSDYGSVTFTKN